MGSPPSSARNASRAVLSAISLRQARSSTTEAAMGARVYRHGWCDSAEPMTRRPPPPRRSGATYRPGLGTPPWAAPYRRTASSGPLAPLPAIILGIAAILAVGLFAGAMAVYAAYTAGLPDVGQIENFQLSEGSTV